MGQFFTSPVRENPGEHKVRLNRTVAGSLGWVVQVIKSLTTQAHIQDLASDGCPPFPDRLRQLNHYERILRNEIQLRQFRQYLVKKPASSSHKQENPDFIPRDEQGPIRDNGSRVPRPPAIGANLVFAQVLRFVFNVTYFVAKAGRMIIFIY